MLIALILWLFSYTIKKKPFSPTLAAIAFNSSFMSAKSRILTRLLSLNLNNIFILVPGGH